MIAEYETIVPCPFAKIRDLVKQWADDVTESAGEFDDCYESRVDEVENQSRDGFIPFTSGGFDGIAYANLYHAQACCCAPAAIQPYLDEQATEIDESWDAENPDHPVAWIREQEGSEPDLFGRPERTDRELWRERFWEFEHESLSEGGTYFYKIRTLFLSPHDRGNDSGEPEILFCVGINTDFEYGRDNIPWLSVYGSKTQQTEWLWEVTAKAADLDARFIEAITREAVDALKTA